jgi:hypothetical protein
MSLAVALLLAAASPTDALAVIRSAALSRDTAPAATLFADDLALVSQSGKLFGKAEALVDLGNGFEAWENSEVVERAAGPVIIVTLVNSRKRPNTDAARFRVLQVWRKDAGTWRLAAQSSTRIAR